MKKLILALAIFMICKGISAQVPQALNYQAIARNSMGQIIPSQNVGVRFTVLDLTGTTILYQETHNSTTNNFGLFTLAIGKGTAVSGTFAGINWGIVGDKYLKVEIAPQGGANYTIQGITQLLSVPYALYAEKVNLVAGPGITINGNVISSSGGSGNDWALLGNSGTTAANFLGTTDNQPFRIRTNNINRFLMDAGQPVTGGNFSISYFSDFASIKTAPAEVAIFGKDVSGTGIPFHLFASVEGMNWAPQGGTNNTLGRIMRLNQFSSSVYSEGKFFDLGMDQGSSFFISDQGLNNTGGILPKKMFTISPQGFTGINFNWGENPTANLHTKGTLRFEGVNTNNTLTRLLVMDINGNISSRDANTLSGGFWVADVNGIHNSNTGHVAIGSVSGNLEALTVSLMEGTLDGRGTAKFVSNDSWQTNVKVDNTTTDKSFSLVVGGSANTLSNYGVGTDNFGVVNGTISSTTSTIPLIITNDNKVGISNSIGGTDNLPKSRLHVRDGDIYIDQVGSGVIMKSPNGQCWRMTVSNAGTPVFTSIPCP